MFGYIGNIKRFIKKVIIVLVNHNHTITNYKHDQSKAGTERSVINRSVIEVNAIDNRYSLAQAIAFGSMEQQFYEILWKFYNAMKALWIWPRLESIQLFNNSMKWKSKKNGKFVNLEEILCYCWRIYETVVVMTITLLNYSTKLNRILWN